MIRLLAVASLGFLASCASARDVAAPHPLELDHVFVYAAGPPEKVIAALSAAGFMVSEEPKLFPDGVRGHYVYFPGSYIELLWPAPDAGIETGDSPFGLGLRRKQYPGDALPIPAQSDTAEWMEQGSQMLLLGDPDNLSQPALFVVPEYMAADNAAKSARIEADFAHPNGAGGVEAVVVTVGAESMPDAELRLDEIGISFVPGRDMALTVRLKKAAGGDRVLDLRPDAAMMLEY